MNLVAQEFVAAQKDNDGVLVLSDQAGVHDGFGSQAVTVSPYDCEGLAEAIDRALVMPATERHRRMERLQRWVAAHDLDVWVAGNVQAVLRAAPTQAEFTKTV
jgi:trehalose 6-phosphate synthase